MNTDVTKLTDLQLANILSAEQDALSLAINNVNVLKQELKKRMDNVEKKEEKPNGV